MKRNTECVQSDRELSVHTLVIAEGKVSSLHNKLQILFFFRSCTRECVIVGLTVHGSTGANGSASNRNLGKSP